MAFAGTTNVLISGANRGLGKGLLELFLAKPDHIVIAGNRDVTSASSKSLADIPKGERSKLFVVKIDATVPTDPFEAVEELKKQGIDHLDLVIANAGVARNVPMVRDLQIADLEATMVPNVYGVVSLYQATRPFLLKAAKPTWATMGSSAGWLENQHPVPNASYAPTKTAVHWLTKRMNGEEENIAALVLDPGWVQTDMGNNGARSFGLEEAPVKLQDSVTGMLKVLEQATKETHGGKMWGYDGKQKQW